MTLITEEVMRKEDDRPAVTVDTCKQWNRVDVPVLDPDLMREGDRRLVSMHGLHWEYQNLPIGQHVKHLNVCN